MKTLDIESPVGAPAAPPLPPLTTGPRRQSSEPVWVVAWRRVQRWIRVPEVQVGLVAAILSIAAFAYYSHAGLLFAYGDAVSHFMISHQVFASRTPGLGQLGSIWLPLTPVLMLPFSWSAVLVRDGIAGSLPSMAAYVVTSVYLFRTGRALFGLVAAGWVAALALMLNPNVLYMQSTAMTELVELCSIIVAVFYATQWARSRNPNDLVIAAAAVAAGSLVRYDAWALAAAVTLVVIYVGWQRQGLIGARASLVLFGTLAFAGCAAYLIYNLVIFHDPLYFLLSPYSAHGQQQYIELKNGAKALPTHHNLPLSIRVYAATVIDSIGWPIALVSVAGLIAFAWCYRLRTEVLAVYAILSIFVFNCVALVFGITTIWTPDVAINGISTYFNVRYGMMLLPLMAIILAFVASRHRILLVTVLGVVLIASGLNPTMGTPYVLREPLNGVLTQGHDNAHQEGYYLAAHYHGGGVLLNTGDMQSTIFFSGLPYSDYITAADARDFPTALAHPEKLVNWIVMDPYAGNYDPVYAALHSRQDWQQYFVLVSTVGTAQIYRRIGG